MFSMINTRWVVAKADSKKSNMSVVVAVFMGEVAARETANDLVNIENLKNIRIAHVCYESAKVGRTIFTEKHVNI